MADVVDGKGNNVDTMGKSLNDLKAMIASLMSGKVGESKPFNKKSESQDKLKELVDELLKTSKSFKSQVDGIKNYVESMKTVLSNIKKENKDGGGFKTFSRNVTKALSGNNASKTTNAMIRILSSNKIIAREIRGLRSVMEPLARAGLEKGSIYVHDIYSQELLRKIAQKQGVSGLDEIPNEFKRISDIVKAGLGGATPTAEDFNKILNKENKRVFKEGQRKGIRIHRSDLKNITGFFSKSKFVDKLTADFDENKSKDIANEIADLTKQGKTWTEIKTQLKNAGYSGGEINKIKQAAEETKKEDKEDSFNRRGLTDLQRFIDNFAGSLLRVDKKEDLTDYFSAKKMFAEPIANFNEYRRILYQTSGAAIEAAGAQRAIFDALEATKEVGVDQDKIEKSIMKNMKFGLKLNKDNLNVTKSQLAAERELGLEADDLNDYFRDFSMHFGLSSTQIGKISTDLAHVAKNAGLTGEAMKSVIDKSRELSKTIKGLGTYTESSNANITSILAEAQKMGVSDSAAEVIKGMSGLTNFLDSKMAPIIGRIATDAGVFGSLKTGQLFENPKKVEAFGESWKKFTKKVTGLDSLDALKELAYQAELAGEGSEEQLKLMALQQKVNAATGGQMQLRDLIAMGESFDKSSMSVTRRLKDLAEKEAQGFLTKEEAEKERLRQTGKSYSDMANLYAKAKANSKTAEEALANFNKSMQDNFSTEDITTLFGKGTASPKEAISKYVESINDQLGKAKMDKLGIQESDIEAALSGGKETFDKFMNNLQEAERKALTAQQALANPIDQAALDIRNLTSTLRKIFLVDLWDSLEKIFGKYIYLMATGAVILSSAAVFFMKFSKSGLQRMFRNLTGNISAIFSSIQALGISDKITSVLTFVEKKIMSLGRGIRDFLTTPISKLINDAKNFLPSFQQIRSATSSFFSNLWGAIRNFGTLLKDSARDIFKSIGDSFRAGGSINNLARRLRDWFVLLGTKPLQALSNAGRLIVDSFRNIMATGKLAVKGVFTGLKAAILGGTGGVAQIIFSAIDGIFGAFKGFQNTERNFNALGVSTKEITKEMYLASTVGGALTGILDGLTFGLLRFSGGAEFVEKFLTALAYSITRIFVGIYEGFMYFMQFMDPVINSFKFLGNSLAELFGMAGEGGVKMEGFFNVMASIGRFVGNVLGTAFVGLSYVLAGLAYAIGGIVKAIDFVLPVIVYPFKLMAKGIGIVYDWFVWLYDVLVGHSIIPDLAYAIVKIFTFMAKAVLKTLGFMLKLPFKLMLFFAKLPFKIMGFLFKAFFKAFVLLPLKILDILSGGMLSKLFKLGSMLWSGIKTILSNVLSSMKNYLASLFESAIAFLIRIAKLIFEKLVQGFYAFLKWFQGTWLGQLITKFLESLKNVGARILSSLRALFSPIVGFIDNFIIAPLKAGFTKLVSFITQALAKIGIGAGAAGAAALAAKGAAKPGTPQPTKAPSPTTAAPGGKDLAKKPTTTATPGGKDLAKQAGKEITGQTAEEIAKQTGKEVAKQAGKEVAQQTGKEVAKQAGKSIFAKMGGYALQLGKLTTKMVSGMPIIGGAIDAGVSLLTGDRFQDAFAGGVGATVGGILGSFGGPFGAAIGSMAGSYLGKKFSGFVDSIMPEVRSRERTRVEKDLEAYVGLHKQAVALEQKGLTKPQIEKELVKQELAKGKSIEEIRNTKTVGKQRNAIKSPEEMEAAIQREAKAVGERHLKLYDEDIRRIAKQEAQQKVPGRFFYDGDKRKQAEEEAYQRIRKQSAEAAEATWMKTSSEKRREQFRKYGEAVEYSLEEGLKQASPTEGIQPTVPKAATSGGESVEKVQPAAASNSTTQSSASKTEMERAANTNTKLAAANSNKLSGIEQNTSEQTKALEETNRQLRNLNNKMERLAGGSSGSMDSEPYESTQPAVTTGKMTNGNMNNTAIRNSEFAPSTGGL